MMTISKCNHPPSSLKYTHLSKNGHMMYLCEECNSLWRDKDHWNIKSQPWTIEQVEEKHRVEDKVSNNSKCVIEWNKDGSMK